MKILLAGASGLIGRAILNKHLHDYEWVLLGRNPQKLMKDFPICESHSWDELDQISGIDVVINLCGENIGAGRWSEKRKAQILNSRIETTQRLAQFCIDHKARLINASAIGIYGLQKTIEAQWSAEYSEETPIGEPTDFLSTVGQQWEAAAKPAIDAGVPVTFTRFAVVLTPTGGALAKMLPAFKMGLGGPIGSGKQPFSWVALEDVVRAMAFILEHPEVTGPVNIVAPQVLSQKDFAKALGKALKRPAFIPMPSISVKLLFGQMGEELLLNGMNVNGQVLEKRGFNYIGTSVSTILLSAVC